MASDHDSQQRQTVRWTGAMVLPSGGSALPPDSDGQVFRRIYSDLRRFAAICASPSQEPDDLLQEAVARTLVRHHLADLKDPGAYLRTVIANLARDAAKHDRVVQRTPMKTSSWEDSYPSQLSDLGRLSADERAAVFLIDVERMSIRSAAQVLDCSVSHARTLRSRAHRKLR